MTTQDQFLVQTCQSLADMDADFRPRDVAEFLSRNLELRDADDAAAEFCRAAARYEYPDTHPGR